MKMHSFDDPAPTHSNRDEDDPDEHRSQASQPLPIMRTSAHKHIAHSVDDEDYDDHDQGLFSSSPPLLFAVSTFSEWGTESNTTDDGAESDPFCFDDETSRAIIHSKPGLSVVGGERKDPSAAIVPSPLGVEVVEVEDPPLKSVVCVRESAADSEIGTVVVVVKNNSLLKRWVKAVWGAVAKIFSRRGRRERVDGKGGKQS